MRTNSKYDYLRFVRNRKSPVIALRIYCSQNPGAKGFNRRGLYRMKQFYETYKDDGFVTPLVTQISRTNHLLIMSSSKTAEERLLYGTLSSGHVDCFGRIKN